MCKFAAWGMMLCVVAAGCNASSGSSDSGQGRHGPADVATQQGDYPIQVASTTGMVADLVTNVGGKYVKTTHLMGEGVDPHMYKASPQDISQLNAADIIFYSGLHLEGKMADVFVHMARKKPTFAVTEYIDEKQVMETADGAYDPHLWFDVELWSQAVGVVRDVLSQYDPAHADEYRAHAEAYQPRLAELHQYARDQIATIPQEQRVLVTAHDAFRYFGRAYDIEVRGIQGISTEDEAGVRKINELVEFITERKINAVFVESSVSPRNVQALVEGCEARGHTVIIGGELFSDAMGRQGTPEGTYEGMVRHNVDTIVRALK